MSTSLRPLGYCYEMTEDMRDKRSFYVADRTDWAYNERQFNHPDPILDWPPDFTVYVKGENQEDYLPAGLHMRIFSDKAKVALRSCGLLGQTEFLPVRMVHADTGADIGRYWAVHVLTELLALDRIHTRWMPGYVPPAERPPGRQGELETLHIMKPALVREVARLADIFRLKESPTEMFVSTRFRRCLEQAGAATGIKFDPIPAY